MLVLIQFVTSLVWSVVGLVVGFILGATYTNRRVRADSMAKTDVMRLTIGLLILAMVIVTASTTLATARAQARSAQALSLATKCQQDFNNKYGGAISKNFEAQRKLFASFRAGAGQLSAAERDKVYQDYFATIQPIPATSSCRP